MKTSCLTLKRLTVAIIAYSCCVLSSVDARSFFFLTPRTEKCALVPVVSETDLHLQYYSPGAYVYYLQNYEFCLNPIMLY